MKFDSSPGQPAGSGWLNRLVELSRYAAKTVEHRTACAILSHMAGAMISKSEVKQLLYRSIVSSPQDTVAPRWTFSEK